MLIKVKKVFSMVLLIVFLMSNIGVTVSMHFCGGLLNSIDIFTFNGHSCKCGKKAMEKNCCKDKTTFLRVKNDLANANQINYKIACPKLIAVFATQTINIPSAQCQYATANFYHPPLFKPKTPIYLLDRVFLI